MSVKCWMSLSLILVSMLVGCRREDIREMTVTMPNLTAADQSKVTEAVMRYGGVRTDSFKWNLSAKTLTLTYDSMRVAQANIRYAIEEAGVKVEFPKKETDHAGY